MVERTLETGETEVRFLLKAHAFVAQWIEHPGSNGKVGGPIPLKGTRPRKLMDKLSGFYPDLGSSNLPEGTR